MKKAVVVIPTYNEKENITLLIEQIFEVANHLEKWQLEILIVDSQSPDNTALSVQELQRKHSHLHLISTKKEGLGKAYIAGFSYAIETMNPYVLFEMDADLSHNPKNIPAFLQQIEKGADFVIGARYIKGGSIPADWGIDRKIYSICANLFVRFGFMKLHISDWTSGYRAIKTWIIKDALLYVKTYSGYVFQVALLDFAIGKGAHIKEVPIQFIDRKNGISKINSIQYTFQTFWYVLSHSSFVKFVIVGLLGFVVDFGFAYVFINSLHIAKTQANMLSAEVAIISNFLINNFWSFRHKKITGGVFAYIRKFLVFNFVSLGSIIIQGVGMFLTLQLLGDTKLSLGAFTIQSWIIYKVFIIMFLIIPYSYVLYNKVVWKSK